MGGQFFNGDVGSSPFGLEYFGKGSFADPRADFYLRWIDFFEIVGKSAKYSFFYQVL